MSTQKEMFLAKKGSPLPLGATEQTGGINFSFFAQSAEYTELVIDYETDGAYTRRVFSLDPQTNKHGDIWHIQLETELRHFYYGLRVNRYEETEVNNILIDPYCTMLKRRQWGEESHYGHEPCCEFLRPQPLFDWQEDTAPETPLNETIIYELHVRGFTNSPSSEVTRPGTFAGLVEKIPHLLDLGITAIELLPVTAFDECYNRFRNPHTGQLLKNFWGYNPISFFATHAGYSGTQTATIAFKEMVRSMHKAGIEVILDMVYNHSGEGDTEGITSSFRALGDTTYYLYDQEENYLNFSGCGNTLNCNHPIIQDIIVESLRYWATEMHVDGFRFDLASILNRDTAGKVISPSPIVERISHDPILRNKKLIAEAWDASGLYQVGTFCKDSRWSEWNGKFRDDTRCFLAGYNNSVTNLATRIAGSSDLYSPPEKTPLTSINFITSHDGFTLYDLMAYNSKNNKDNGENNRDGENHNLSWNSRFDDTDQQLNIDQIENLRMRRMRTAAVILLFSQGVPMITAGDEFARTQQGNNNGWCQDNEIGWIDWSLAKKNKDLLRFFKMCIALRKQYPHFRRDTFFNHETGDVQEKAEIEWQYLKPHEQNWTSDCHALGFHLKPLKNHEDQGEFFVFLNSDRIHSLEISLPSPCKGTHWHSIVNTAAISPDDFSERTAAKLAPTGTMITVLPMTAMVFQCP